MAATNQLPKIAALADQVQPLGNKQTGMPILAEEWNAIIAVLSGLLEVARAQEESAQGSLEQRFAPIDHQHLGQVTVPWLDANLQNTVGNGGGGVSSRLAITDMNQRLQGLSTQVALLTTNVENQRRQVDGFAVNDVDRAKTLRDFDTRFAGVADLKTSVTSLGGQIDGLKAGVDSVLQLRQSLTDPAGAPIDVQKIQLDVANLQTLRDNLTGVDGTLVRMRDIELKLKEVSDTVGVGGAGGLDGRLATLGSALETKLTDAATARENALVTQLRGETKTAVDNARSDFTASLTQARTDMDASVDAKIKAGQDQVTASTTTQITAALQAFRTESNTTVNGLLDERFAAFQQQVQTLVTSSTNAGIAALKNDLNATITTQIQKQTAALSPKIDAKLTDVQAQFDQLSQTVQDSIKTTIASASDSLLASTNTRVDSQVAQARQAIESGLDARVKTAIDANNATLDTRVGAAVDQRLSNLDTRIANGVTAGLKDLPGEISSEVKNQITALNVPAQIATATSSVVTQYRSELARAIADQQARTTTAINDSVKLLRGEIGVASTNAVNTAVERFNASHTFNPIVINR